MQANGRVFKKVVCGEYSWLTYAQVDARAKAFGRGLAVLGQQIKENIVIFSETKADWMICAQGCFAQNFPSKLPITGLDFFLVFHESLLGNQLGCSSVRNFYIPAPRQNYICVEE